MASRVQHLHKQGLLGHIETFIPESIQYEVLMGSVAYGVSDDTSDMDLYGFCIPPKHYVFPHLRGEIPGFTPPGPTFKNYQKHHILDQSANGGKGQEYDIDVYSIVRYFALVMDNNPNMVDSLFVPRRCILYSTEIGELVRGARRKFLHKGAYHRFKGYAYAQMKKLRSQTRKGKRAAAVTASGGMDCKFAYHVVRLADECEQILTLGDIDLTRDRERLKAIRAGEWTIEQIEDFFGSKEQALERAYEESELPYSPDVSAIQALLEQCLEQHYGSMAEAFVRPDAGLRNALAEIERIASAAIGR